MLRWACTVTWRCLFLPQFCNWNAPPDIFMNFMQRMFDSPEVRISHYEPGKLRMSRVKCGTTCPQPWSGPDMGSPPPCSRSESTGWGRFLLSSPTPAGSAVSPLLVTFPPPSPPLSLPVLAGLCRAPGREVHEGYRGFLSVLYTVCVYI